MLHQVRACVAERAVGDRRGGAQLLVAVTRRGGTFIHACGEGGVLQERSLGQGGGAAGVLPGVRVGACGGKKINVSKKWLFNFCFYSETCDDGRPLGLAICVPTGQVSSHARGSVLKVT